MTTRTPITRRPYSPKPRDEAIYRAVRIAGRSQADVAAEMGVAQSTVSRAVKRFHAWRATSDPAKIGDFSLRQQDRVGRWLAHERHEEIYAESMRLARRMHQPAVATRTGERDAKKFSDETRRDQHAVAARFLRTAQRSADALTHLAEPSPLDQEQLDEPALCQGLLRLREAAEASGAVPKSESPYSTVCRWLAALLGREMFSIPPDVIAPGSALGELVRTVMSTCYAGTSEEMLRRLADSPPPSNNDDSEPYASDSWEGEAPAETWEADAPSNPTLNPEPRTLNPLPLAGATAGLSSSDCRTYTEPPAEPTREPYAPDDTSLNPEPFTGTPGLNALPRIKPHKTHNRISPPAPVAHDDAPPPPPPTPYAMHINVLPPPRIPIVKLPADVSAKF